MIVGGGGNSIPIVSPFLTKQEQGQLEVRTAQEAWDISGGGLGFEGSVECAGEFDAGGERWDFWTALGRS